MTLGKGKAGNSRRGGGMGDELESGMERVNMEICPSLHPHQCRYHPGGVGGGLSQAALAEGEEEGNPKL